MDVPGTVPVDTPATMDVAIPGTVPGDTPATMDVAIPGTILVVLPWPVLWLSLVQFWLSLLNLLLFHFFFFQGRKSRASESSHLDTLKGCSSCL